MSDTGREHQNENQNEDEYYEQDQNEDQGEEVNDDEEEDENDEFAERAMDEVDNDDSEAQNDHEEDDEPQDNDDRDEDEEVEAQNDDEESYEAQETEDRDDNNDEDNDTYQDNEESYDHDQDRNDEEEGEMGAEEEGEMGADEERSSQQDQYDQYEQYVSNQNEDNTGDYSPHDEPEDDTQPQHYNTSTKTTFTGGTQFDGSTQQYYHDDYEQDEEESYETRRRQQEQHAASTSTQNGPRSRVLNIEVYYGEGVGTNFLSIEVIEPPHKKPFLGGYRHRKTHIEYHHASAQTEYISAKKRALMLSGAPLQDVAALDEDQVPKFHRETQTVKTKTTSQQTMREQGTQMAKPGVVIDTSNDRVYIPSNTYFSSEDLHNLRVEHAIKIQAFVRGWRARKRATELAQQKQDTQEKAQLHRAEEQRLEGERKRKELQRRMHPKTKKDFEVLYNELEQWRQQETERIKEHETDPEARRLAMAELLRKETKLLQTIDRLKQSAAKENAHEKVNKKLEFLAKPKQLDNWDGATTFVETPFTVRARELMDLYHGLGTPMLSVDERLDVLLHVKWTVKEFDCILTRDIVELIDREADLLNRGRKNASLDGLRKRLSNLFLQFIETPEFNPLSSKLNKTATTKFANTQPLNA